VGARTSGYGIVHDVDVFHSSLAFGRHATTTPADCAGIRDLIVPILGRDLTRDLTSRN